MKLFKTVVEFFRKRGWFPKRYDYQPIRQDGGAEVPLTEEEFVCTHGETDHNLKVMVLGVECELRKSPMCQTCTEQYLNKFSTLCAFCREPIFPGTAVGQAWHGAPHPFTHLTFECCESGGLYCGIWDEGRLRTLHELDPEKYPAETSSLLDHTFNTGNMVIENLNI